MYSLLDNFTGTATTAVTSHTSDTGQTWALHPNAHYSGFTAPKIDSANRLRAADGNDVVIYASGSPIADVVCTAVIKCYTLPGSLQIIAPTVRTSTSTTATWYAVWFSADGSTGTIQVYKYVNTTSAGVAVGSAYNFTVVAGTTYTMVVRAVGPTIRVSLDGTERVNTTDTDITAAGAFGAIFYASVADGSGLALDSITATDAYTKTQVSTTVDMTILTPPGYDGSTPTGAVELFHGNNGDRDFWLDNTYMPGMRSKLLEDGYILFCTSAGNHWGDDAGLAKCATGHAYLLANYNISGVVLNGQSMGGPLALRAIRDSGSFAHAKGFIGTYPVCDVLAEYDDNSSFDSQILTAWSAADRTALVAALAGKNPVDLSAAGYPNRRYKFWASDSDTVVLKAHNTDAMRTVLDGTTTIGNTLVTTTGDHGDASNFDPPVFSSDVATMLADPDPTSTPATPTSFSITSIDATGMTVGWTGSANAGSFTDLTYQIERSTNGTDFTLLTYITGTSYKDTTTVNGVTYYYRVYASSAEFGESAVTDSDSGVAQGPVFPDDTTPPTLDTAVASTDGTSVVLTFDEDIEDNTAISGLSLTAFSASIASAELTDTDEITLTLSGALEAWESPALSYFPGNLTDTSDNALEAFSNFPIDNSSNTNDPAPAAPQGLTLATSDGQITVSWLNNPPGDFDHYELEQSTDGENFTLVDDTITDSSFDVTGLDNGTRYYFRIRAVDSASQAGGYSEISSGVAGAHRRHRRPPLIIVYGRHRIRRHR